MTPTTSARLARSIWIFTVVALAPIVTIFVMNPERSRDPLIDVVAPLMAIGYVSVGALVVSRQPHNPIGWLYTASGLSLALVGLTEAYLRLGSVGNPLPGAPWVAWANGLFFILTVVPISFSLLLFPAGDLPSPRWKVVAWVMGGAPLVAILGGAVQPGQVGGETLHLSNPAAVESLSSAASLLLTVGAVGSVIGGIACVAGLVVRFRRARGEERQQLRWVAFAAGTAAIVLLAVFMAGLLGQYAIIGSLFILFLLSLAFGIPAASAVAILKYRLYDLDIVIKKTVVFALVGAVITALYIVVVLAIPTLIVGIGSGGGFSPIQFLAVTLVALAINPVRTRARRWADRLVYGKRATPYEVLSELADRVGGTYSTEDVLPRMAQLVSAGTGARLAQVWLRVGTELRLEAQWPHDEGAEAEPRELEGIELPSFEPSQAFPSPTKGSSWGRSW